MGRGNDLQFMNFGGQQATGHYYQYLSAPPSYSYPAPWDTSSCFTWDDPDSKYRRGVKFLLQVAKVCLAIAAFAAFVWILLPMYHKHQLQYPVVELFRSENCDKDAHKIVINAETEHYSYSDRYGAAFQGRRGYSFCDFSFDHTSKRTIDDTRASKNGKVKSIRVHHGAKAYLFNHCKGPNAPYTPRPFSQKHDPPEPLNKKYLGAGWFGFATCHRLDSKLASAKYIEVRSSKLDLASPKKVATIKFEESFNSFANTVSLGD